MDNLLNSDPKVETPKIVWSPSTQIQRSPDLVGVEMDGETVMMSINAGAYYGFKSVAARIWELMENPVAFSALVAAIVSQYEVDEATCAADLEGFLDTLHQRKMITILDGS